MLTVADGSRTPPKFLRQRRARRLTVQPPRRSKEGSSTLQGFGQLASNWIGLTPPGFRDAHTGHVGTAAKGGGGRTSPRATRANGVEGGADDLAALEPDACSSRMPRAARQHCTRRVAASQGEGRPLVQMHVQPFRSKTTSQEKVHRAPALCSARAPWEPLRRTHRASLRFPG